MLRNFWGGLNDTSPAPFGTGLMHGVNRIIPSFRLLIHVVLVMFVFVIAIAFAIVNQQPIRK